MKIVARILVFLALAPAALATSVPTGFYSLEKGTSGCSSQLQLRPKLSCEGMQLRDLDDRSEWDFCNINHGNYHQRWKEEGLDFFVESQSRQVSNLLRLSQVRKAHRDGKVLRRSQAELALFFRGGRLEFSKIRDGRTWTCLYQRQSQDKKKGAFPPLSLNQGMSQNR